MLKPLLLIPTFVLAVAALTWLVQLPFPAAWAAFVLLALLTGAGVQRRSLRLLSGGWLGFLVLGFVLAVYAADELADVGSGGTLLTLGFGLGLGMLLVLTLQASQRLDA